MTQLVAERIVEAIFLLILAMPLGRLAFDGGLQRRFRAFPPMQALVTGSLALYVAAVFLVAAIAPSLLRAFAVAAVIILAVDWWQRRSSYGLNRKLPPGSLAFLRAAPWRDPRFYEKEAGKYGSVFKFRHFVDPAVGIVGLERIGDFMRANERNLLIPPAPFNMLIPGGFVRYMSGSGHQSVSSVLRSAFTPAVIDACDNDFASYSRVALGAIESENGNADPVSTIERLVYDEMMLCFLGLEPGATYDRFVELYKAADYRELAHTGKQSARAAILEIVGDIRRLAAADAGPVKRISFLSELAAAHPDLVASDEVLGNFAYALHTARLDVSGLLVWVIAILAENPDWVVKLRASVRTDETDALRVGGLGDRIVRETLRLRQSEFLLRRVKDTIDWEGYRIPTGWHVRMCIAESHRSAESFEDPEVFNPDRFMQPQNRKRYSPFGLAPHLCPGEHLTRAMGKHLAVELARKHDVSARDIEPWEFSGFHWRPSQRMRVTLSRVT